MKYIPINYKNYLVLFAFFICCFLFPKTGFCQTEKLGIVSYTPPKWMTKTFKGNVVAFSELNRTTGGFCIITLYGATQSSGDPQSDFTREWDNLVIKPLKAEANPKTETQLADGWTIIAGGAETNSEVGKAAAFLTVISGRGKTISILAVFNKPEYITQVDAFISTIDLDKTAAITINQTSPQNNQPGKFGSMTYTSPAGWGQQQFPDGVVFKPLDLPTGEHLTVQIMMPLNASGTLEQALAQSYLDAATMYQATLMNYAGTGKNYDPTIPQKSFQGWEYIRGKGGVRVQDGTEVGLELFVIKVNKRFERIAILESRKNCNLSRYYASDRISYRNEIENLLFSIRFSDLSETTLASGSTAGNGITGVWQGISLSVGGPSTGETLGVRYKVFSPIFLSNGQVYFGPKFPTSGLDGLNTRIPPELFRRDWGTYTFNNGRGVLKMPYGDIPLRMEGHNLVITVNQTDHKFYRLPSVDGATFNGTYALSGVEGKIFSVTFTADGRFTDNGAIKVMYHEYIDCINPANAPGSGTYEVKDYTINFNYSDGRKIKLAFLGADYNKSNPSPATLLMSFNEDKLIRN
jgi:hypothetical protein